MSIEWRAPRTHAHIGLAIQFLALIRCIGEYFRLKYVQGDAFDLDVAEVFLMAAMCVSVLLGLGVLAYTLQRPRITTVLAVLTVAILLAMKVLMLG